MNHLVFLERRAGELEKILSGVKCMLVKEIQPPRPGMAPVNPGDSLYFLRDKDDGALRVKASVVRVFSIVKSQEVDLAQPLKEFQPRLQLTENQYNYWSTQKQVQLVEFTRAEKVEVIQVSTQKIAGRLNWIAFEEFSQIKSGEVAYELDPVKPES